MLTKTPPSTEEKTRHITSKRIRRQAGQSLTAKATGFKYAYKGYAIGVCAGIVVACVLCAIYPLLFDNWRWWSPLVLASVMLVPMVLLLRKRPPEQHAYDLGATGERAASFVPQPVRVRKIGP